MTHREQEPEGLINQLEKTKRYKIQKKKFTIQGRETEKNRKMLEVGNTDT